LARVFHPNALNHRRFRDELINVNHKLTSIPGKRSQLILALLLATLATAWAGRQEQPIDLSKLQTPVYAVAGDALIRHNGDRYCNRPLYCLHTPAVALAGDKPCAMVGSGKVWLGNLMFALVSDGHGIWLQDASDITSIYRPGRMEWIIRDAAWGATTVHLEVVPAAQGAGMAAHLRVDQAAPGQKLVWASGGFSDSKGSILQAMDMTSQDVSYMHRGFDAKDCQGNVAQVRDNSWTLRARDGKSSLCAAGTCSVAAPMVVADAGQWRNPLALLASQGNTLPLVCGSFSLAANAEAYWYLRAGEADDNTLAMPATAEFAAGLERQTNLETQVVVDTPDPWLNAGVAVSVHAIDGTYRDGIFTHAGMRWGVPLLGWRTLFGATTYGFHDAVKNDAATFISHQITTSDKTAPHADPQALLSSQAPDSRLFGRGRINFHQPNHYDMQSQFFDQVAHAWRWTGDAELEQRLRPALDLHCEYLQECFDPAGLGIYESYANTWPTDDQWYNGGGTSEETAYAYRAEETVGVLAQRAGDEASAGRHAANAARIRQAFFDLLWIPRQGHPGAYREQTGLKRLHESPWLYGIFCPIDAGLLDTEQAAQALQFTEWGLERVTMPYGGEQCWPSDWVPSVWSVREMWPGDNYGLALAYFQTGLAEDGWKLLRGTFPQQMFFGNVPGDLGHPAGGTDFNDCGSMFARAVVEGLFGCRPDYPAGVVTFAPQFPGDWDHASIQTPDLSLRFARSGGEIHFDVTLARACGLDLRIPVATKAVQSVTVDGQPAKWTLTPGFGRSIVNLSLPATRSAKVEVICADSLPVSPALHLAGNSGEPLALKVGQGTLIDFHDPQGVLAGAKIDRGTITGILATNAGDHLVFGLAQTGETRRWELFKIHVTDASAEAYQAAKTQITPPSGARWAGIDLRPVFNGDIRAIYRQQYLSPRPNTCSLRLGTDGYSTWQMAIGGASKAPDIDLTGVPALSDGHGQIVAGNGVPFLWPNGSNNIAFTSQWDNWPREVTVPVARAGDAVWFLLGGSTDPMEVRIANARLRLKYADGVIETLDLVPPLNFWTLCPFGGIDYDYQRDGFALPKVPPATLQLGQNCRAVVLGWRLRPGVALESVTLETLSSQVVIGLMGVTVMDSK
jgi:hypothetical protein